MGKVPIVLARATETVKMRLKGPATADIRHGQGYVWLRFVVKPPGGKVDTLSVEPLAR